MSLVTPSVTGDAAKLAFCVAKKRHHYHYPEKRLYP